MIQLLRGETKADIGTYRLSLDFDGKTDAIMIPKEVSAATIVLTPTAASRVEWTISPDADSWLPWPLGDVSDVSFDSLTSPVVAIRAVGSGRLEVFAK